MQIGKDDVVATFSIVGFDPEAKEWGVAVQSKFLGVGSVVPWAKAGVGAIATQSWANTSFGPAGLAMLKQGMDSKSVLEKLLETDEGRELRQVGIVDAEGNGASFTGSECFDWAGGITGTHFACQGNILVNAETVQAMSTTFLQSTGHLADRLVDALAAAQSAGGDSRGKQSAALLVVKENGGYGGFNDRMIDLRVDDHVEPIDELKRLLSLHKLYLHKTKPGNLIKIDVDKVMELQTALQKTNYYTGKITGLFDQETKDSLKTFFLTENFDDRYREDGMIDKEVVEFLLKLAEKN